MKKNSKNKPVVDDEMLPEYDFSGGVRGKHYKAYRRGHTVIIHKEDGSTVIQRFTPIEGSVVLEEDVQRYFPDSESVNSALRLLISLIPRQRRVHARAR